MNDIFNFQKELPPKLSLRQKISYGFYDYFVSGIKTSIWISIKAALSFLGALVGIGLVIKFIPFFFDMVYRIIRFGIDIGS